MGIALPQIVTSDRASGAQVIDGSLKFNDSSKTNLSRTPSSAGSRQKTTWIGWTKRSQLGDTQRLMFVGPGSNYFSISFNNDTIQVEEAGGSYAFYVYTNALFRDPSAWYHVVVAVDTAQGTETNRVKVYVNGIDQVLTAGNNWPPLNADLQINNTVDHRIGRNDADCFNGSLSNVYLIDGQALGPEYFGFTDPLTNTWRPKKYEGTFGTNGFSLPFDGNSPIGEDKSGLGNDYTPVNFGGSNSLDKATGARPILNTDGGGNVARPGVFGSEQNVGYAVTVYNDGGGNKYYIDGTKQATLNGLIRGATYTFDTSDSTLGSTHPFRLSATSAHGTEYTDGVVAITGAATTITVPHNAPNSLYYYCTAHSGMGSSITGITTNEKLADQYASNCVLAVPFVGSTDDASAGLACTSTTKADTNSGSTASSALYNFYSGSRDFDGSNDTCSFASVPACGAGDWTVEFWLYSEASSTDTVYRRIVSTGTNSASAIQIGHIGEAAKDGGYITYTHSDGSVYAVNTSKVTDRWAHIAVVRESGSVNVYTDGIKGTTADSDANDKTGTTWYVSGYGGSTSSGRFNGKIQDLRVYPGVAKYTSNFSPAATSPDILPDTPSGVSGGSKLAKITDGAVSFDGTGDYLTDGQSEDYNFGTGSWTIECFAYFNNITSSQDITDFTNNASATGSPGGQFYFSSSGGGTLQWYESSTAYAAAAGKITPKRWHHLAVVKNSSGDTIKIYIDGKEGGSSSHTESSGTNAGSLRIGLQGSTYFNGFLSNLRVIKGTALYTTDFTPSTAPLTNVTNTKLLCCQSNTSATAAAVTPGSITANGDAAATNFNPFNTDINTVRGQETGYNTLNPLAKASITLSNGNLDLTHSGSTGYWQLVLSTIGMSSGKFYCEFLCQDADSVIGIAKGNHVIANDKYVGQDPGGYSYNGQNGQKINNSSGSSYGSSYAAGDVIGIAFDGDNGTLRFYKNNIDQGQAFSGLGDEYYFAFSIRDTGHTHSVNFGQKPFKFPPPAGFQPLNAANLRPETVISRPDHYYGIVTYTGTTGAGTIKDDNIKFTPDFVWLKSRSNSEGHALYDTVRGSTGGNFYRLRSDTTAAQNSPTNELSSMIEGGFTVNNNGHCYYNGYTYVAWCWRAGGSKNTFNIDDVGYASAAAAGLDGGTINPTGASVGTRQGFSILKYQGNGTAGANISHGLLEAPKLMIHKSLDQSRNWYTITTALDGSADYLYLNTSGAAGNSSVTAPTSSLMYFTSSAESNNNTENYVVYMWHDVPGLQKFGTYVGNADTDGTFVELGFRPRWIMQKNTSGQEWFIHDTARDPINVAGFRLVADLNVAENTSNNTWLDILSNGFKLRTTNEAGNSGTFIYMAWAEAPTFNLFGGSSNAR